MRDRHVPLAPQACRAFGKRSTAHRIAIEKHWFAADEFKPFWTAITFQPGCRISRGTSAFGLSISVRLMRELGGWNSGRYGRRFGAVCSANIRVCGVMA